ncbi:hypothetical protein H0H92_008236 [Tricholoma furcatifolium]|nr:hypothetical protein H0H92_008236 [Tricholoma furcatifolium]
MPKIELATSSGPIQFNYTISTPTLTSSASIDGRFPSIVFLHGEYIPQELFEAQFSDPLLRKQFNLIGLDLRAYGQTDNLASEDYTPAVAADDLYVFLNTLQVPTVHVLAVSIGCHVALELALAHPESVASLTLYSMPPPQEPPEVLAGRQEVFDFWNDAGEHEGGSIQEEADLDDELVTSLVRGIEMMLFGERSNALTGAIIGHALVLAKTIWAGSPEALSSSHVVLIDWFAKRRIFDVATLSKLKCPVSVIHGEEDIAYPLHAAQVFVAALQDARVDVEFHRVSAPHFGNVTDPDLINPILCDTVLSVVGEKTPVRATPAKVITDRHLMHSPFVKTLAMYGYSVSDDDSDSS